MLNKLQEASIKNGLETKFDDTQYMATTGEEVQNLEVANGQGIKWAEVILTKHGTTE